MTTVYQAKAYSAASKTSPLASASIPRRDTTARDVQIEILFCGIYHSDLPGHEIVGRVSSIRSRNQVGLRFKA